MLPDQLTAKGIELVWRLKREEWIGDDSICFCPMMETTKTSHAISEANCLHLPPWTECGLQGRGTTASFLTKARCVNRMQHLWENRAVVSMTKEETHHPKSTKDGCVCPFPLSLQPWLRDKLLSSLSWLSSQAPADPAVEVLSLSPALGSSCLFSPASSLLTAARTPCLCSHTLALVTERAGVFLLTATKYLM